MSEQKQEQELGHESDGSDGSSGGPDSDRGFRIDYCADGSDDLFSINVFGRNIQLKQKPNDRQIGHGAVVWEAAVVFAKYMEYCPHNKDLSISSLNGKSVLELGSGPGLAGMCIMLRGAQLVATDLPEVISALTYDNIRRFYRQLRSEGSGTMSGVEIKCPRVCALDWTHEGAVSELQNCPPIDEHEHALTTTATTGVHEGARDGEEPSWPALRVPFDLVLLTDCIFSVHLVPHIVRTIRQAIGQRSVVYCVHEIRDTEANAEFLRELGIYFKYKVVPSKDQHPEYRHELVQIVIAKPRRRLG